MDVFLFIIECLGVVSFSISGTIVAIRKKTDVVGAIIFAMLTAFGGGILRDLVLGINPPNFFFNKEYFILAALDGAVCIACYFSAFHPKVNEFINKHRHDFILDVTDAIGLAVFTVFGVEVAADAVGVENKYLLIFSGCITGVGGGILRDICTAQIPTLFRKRVYFIPVLLGSLIFSLAHKGDEHVSNTHVLFMMIAILVIIVLRILAIKFKWNLPTVGFKEEERAENETSQKKD